MPNFTATLKMYGVSVINPDGSIVAARLPSTLASTNVSNLFTVAQGIRGAVAGGAAGLYVPWVSGDTLPTLFAGGTNASNNQPAVKGVSYGNYAIIAQASNFVALLAERDSSLTNSVATVLSIYHKTSATPVAAFGTGIRFLGSTSIAASQTMVDISALWTDAADATRTSALSFWTTNAAITSERMRLTGVGALWLGLTSGGVTGAGDLEIAGAFKAAGDMRSYGITTHIKSNVSQMYVYSQESPARGSSLMSFGAGAGDSLYVMANAYYSGGFKVIENAVTWMFSMGAQVGDKFVIYRAPAPGSIGGTAVYGSPLFTLSSGGNLAVTGHFYAAGWFYPGNQSNYFFGMNGLSLYANGNFIAYGVISPGNQGTYYLSFGSYTYANTMYVNTGFECVGLVSSGWMRTIGAVGWYSQTYGGGIYQTTSAYIEVYGGKGLYVPGTVGLGTAPVSAHGLTVNAPGSSSGEYGLVVRNSASGNLLWVRSDGLSNYISAVGWNVVSDQRVKDQITAIDPIRALQVVNHLQPRTYTLQNDPGQLLHSGYIAQDVQSIPALAHAVTPTADGTLTLSYDHLSPYHTGAIQALTARIGELQAEQLMLKGRIDYLEGGHG